MIERGASLPMGDRLERGPGRVLRTAARVAAQGSWGTLVVWREPGRSGLIRSGPEVSLCARVRSNHGPWSEGQCQSIQTRRPSRGEEQAGMRGSVWVWTWPGLGRRSECVSVELGRPVPGERVYECGAEPAWAGGASESIP